MRPSASKTIVIAFGGSILHPDEIDVLFLKQFAKFVRGAARRGRRLVLVVGGGRLSRRFQDAAGRVARLTNEDKDWIGIHATRLHAHLLRTVFRDIADPVVIDKRHRLKKLTHPVTIASGWRPGWSTDYVAAALAKDFGAREFIVAGKPAHVYDKDPEKHKDSRPLKEISWAHYRKLIPAKWAPGSHAPVDPVAARLAHGAHLAAIIINGKDLKNFARLLEGKPFVGTTIK